MSNERQFTRSWFYKVQRAFRWTFKGWTGRPNLQYLEIGVFEGRSACWMFDNVLTHKECRGWGIDPYTGYLRSNTQANSEAIYERAKANLAGLPFTLWRDTSWNVLINKRPFANEQFDIIYVDGDHRPTSAYLDFKLCWPLLKNGGIMLGDDYNLEVGGRFNRSVVDVPNLGYDQFVTEHENELEVLAKGVNIILKKRKNDI